MRVWVDGCGRFDLDKKLTVKSLYPSESVCSCQLEDCHYGSMYTRLTTVDMLYNTMYAVRECVWSSRRFFCEREIAGARSSNLYPLTESKRREKQGYVDRKGLNLHMSPCQVRIFAQNVGTYHLVSHAKARI